MRRDGFSLIEISVVLLIVATVLSSVLPAITEGTKIKATEVTTKHLEAIQSAIQAHYTTNGILPCPAPINAAVNVAAFGVEDSGANCQTGAVATRYGASGNAVGGGVPTKTLGLPDEYAFDGWGRRIAYHVDFRFTDTATVTTAGSIKVYDDTGTGGVARTTAAVYALISSGRNGHGGFTRGGAAFNSGSTNAHELENCQSNVAPCAVAYDDRFIQKMEQADSTTATDKFDDIVAYRLLGHITSGSAGAKVSQGLYATWSQSLASGSNTTITGMTVVNNDMPNSTFAAGIFTVGAGDDGWYTLSASAYAPNAGDELYVAVYVNGSPRAIDSDRSATGSSTCSATTAYRLTAGNTVRADVRQLSGATKVFTGSFSVARVSGSEGSGGGGGGGSSFWDDAGSNNINNTNSGNVGIGVVGPTTKLDVAGTIQSNAVSGLELTNPDAQINLWGESPLARKWGIATSGAAADDDFIIYDREASQSRLVIDENNGNVGIGTPVPGYKLHVGHANAAEWTASFNNTGVYAMMAHGNYGVHGVASNPGSIGTYGVVTSTGSFGNLSYAQHPTSHAFLAQNLSSGYYCYIGYLNTHSLVCSGPTSIPSDRDLKKDIRVLDAQEGLGAIMQLRPVHYNWKDDRKNSMGRKQVGFIAQEVERVLPDLVSEVREPVEPPAPSKGAMGTPMALPGNAQGPLRKALEYDGFIPHAILAIQQLNAKVDELAGVKPIEPEAVVKAQPKKESGKADAAPSIAMHHLPHWLLVLLGLQSIAIVWLLLRRR